MKKYVIVSLLVLLSIIVKGQPITKEWSVNVGGSGEEVTGFFMDAKSVIDMDKDGNIVMVTSTASTDSMVSAPKGTYDCFITKYSPDGTLIWSKSFGGTGYDIPRKVMCLDNGDFVLAGHTRSNDGDLTNHHGGSDGEPDAFMARFNTNGDVLWAKQYGGSTFVGSPGRDYFYSFIQKPNGHFAVVGETNSQNGDLAPDWIGGDPSFYVGWFCEINQDNGGLQTSKRLRGTSHSELNANRTEDIVALSDGSGYAVLGNQAYFLSDFYWITKIDSAGDIIWQKEYGADGSFTYISGITETYDGNIIFTGSVGSGSKDVIPSYFNGGAADIWLVKLRSEDGVMLDQRCFGGTGSEMPYKIIPDRAGKYYLAGYTNSNDGYVHGPDQMTDNFVVYFDEQFDTLWTYKFGGSQYDAATDVLLGDDQKLYIAGASTSSDGFYAGTGFGGTDAWLGKFTDPLTKVQPAKEAVKISLFPNPANGALNIFLPGQSGVWGDIQVHIYDQLGQRLNEVMYTPHPDRNNLEVFTGNLPQGIYIVEVQFSDEVMFSKFTVRH